MSIQTGRNIPFGGADSVKHFINKRADSVCRKAPAGSRPVWGKSQRLFLVLTSEDAKYGFEALTEGGFHQAANREINKNTSFTYALYFHLFLMINYLPFFTIPWRGLLCLSRMPFIFILTFLFLTKKIIGVLWKAWLWFSPGDLKIALYVGHCLNKIHVGYLKSKVLNLGGGDFLFCEVWKIFISAWTYKYVKWEFQSIWTIRSC